MAAYAALASLINTMDQIKIHPLLSTCFNKSHIESLGETVGFLLDFIESYNGGGRSKQVEDLECQIASAAYAAEYAIESHVVDLMLDESTKRYGGLLEKMMRRLSKRPKKFYLPSVIRNLQKVTEDVGKLEKQGRFEDQTPLAASSRPVASARKISMVGFDDYLIRLMDRLTAPQSHQLAIPIIGMGGVGKTTLARNAFDNLLIKQHFDFCAWTTISQNYSVIEILLQLLSSPETRGDFMALDEHKLGEKLHKTLFNRRYLVVLDDMWSIDVWDKIKFFFPDNDNGSRIVVTSRLNDISPHFNSPYLAIDLLDEDKSWNLFCQESFGEEGCPAELEEVGKKICENCKGLPLSIVVIGGFLRQSRKSRGYLEGVARDTYSILNSEEDNRCMNILSLSYNHLPAHLKPCFLYMGVFAEDAEIVVSRLILLWVAEGFLIPNDVQTPEEIANGFLKDLVSRNLVLVKRWGNNGKIRACNIHDLVRELCLNLGEKEKCAWVMKLVGTPRAINRKRRILIDREWMSNPNFSRDLGCASLVRSLIRRGFLEADLRRFNLRFLVYKFNKNNIPRQHIPKKIYFFWDLQTLIIEGHFANVNAPSKLWKMIQLRHLKVSRLYLPDPPAQNERVDPVLSSLQTLQMVMNFRLSEEVCNRIPNVKKLGLVYIESPDATSHYCPQNLGRFHKLESLTLDFKHLTSWRPMVLNMIFPSKLKKLSLRGGGLCWEDLEMVGSLPNLEVLKLALSMTGFEWSPVEGEFQRLKLLEIHCVDLIAWNAEHFHFPVLEKLVLGFLRHLDEIPSGIGEIPTLQVIQVTQCSMPCALSAVKILEEQESLGNENLQLEIGFSTQERRDIFKEMVEKEGGFTSKNLHIKESISS